ncbi:MAG: UDP-N-acetylmuramoyl-tripeptide--D-alanyl-D-alanine ligase [Acidimicrobiia bacterium]|nr:UDP-N-acetylmuramoyl-tripeptide--D-alanyl-D-alanine ligase [Acidimicrobiia bacterium]
MELTAREIARIAGGEMLAGDPDARVSSYAIDSRVLEPGDCFVALRGVRDGHDFLTDAFAKGAIVALVSEAVDAPVAGATLVRVAEPLAALGALAGHARTLMADTTVVAITGSAGKTATKDLTAAAVATSRRVHASPLSFNNESGLPLTVLSAPDNTEVLIAEMGARFAGNIAALVEIARPQVGVITHVGMAHAEHLGGREGIAREKGELVEALPASGLAVLNAACDASADLATRTAARVLRVGRAPDADIVVRDVVLDDELRARFVLETPWGRAPVALALLGEHQVENAAMAAAVALELGASLEAVVSGLEVTQTASLRMEMVRTATGVVVINDAYNSSPTSAAAAIRSFAHLRVTGRRLAVLGPMLELGSHAAEEHEALGALAAATGIDVLVAVGEGAEHIVEGARGAGARGSAAGGAPRRGSGVSVVTMPDAAAATGYLIDEVRFGDAVLVKASRAVGLEAVADALVRGASA